MPAGEARPVTIVGFPEHIFTQSSGFVTAIYMAVQELTLTLTPTPALAITPKPTPTPTPTPVQERYFGTFFQRVLASPLDVRMHYGHPDLLDKAHLLTPTPPYPYP